MDGLGEQRYLINSLIKKIKFVEESKYEQKKNPLLMMDGLITGACVMYNVFIDHIAISSQAASKEVRQSVMVQV